MRPERNGLNTEGSDHVDIISYLMGLIAGKKEGAKVLVFEGDGYTFTDPDDDGNLVIEEADE